MNKNIFSFVLFLLCSCMLLTGCSLNSELQGYIFGNATPTLFKTSVGIQLGVALLMFLWAIKNRDKNSSRSPEEWNWKFFWKDSIWRIIITPFFVLLATRVLFFFKMDPNLAILISIVLGGFAHKFGDLFAKASKGGFDVVSDKIDEVTDTLKHTEVIHTKTVETKVVTDEIVKPAADANS